jgi:SnoaL-like protein
MMSLTPHPVARYVPLLIAGDVEGLLDLFGDAPRINDPRLGWIEGAMVEAFVVASAEGLSERQARVEHLLTTVTASGAVEECVLSLVRRGAAVRLPVAIAAALSAGVLDSIRIYHSMWPLVGAHFVRRAILPARPDLVLPEVIERSHRSLARGDVAGLLRQFETDGSVHEQGDEPEIHRGPEELRRFFEGLLARGGVDLERCSVTDDGTCCALEYNLTGCGPTRLPRQAGLAVYERGAHSGLLASARVYDDIEKRSVYS